MPPLQVQSVLVAHGARQHGGMAVVSRKVVDALCAADPSHHNVLAALVVVFAVAVQTVPANGRPGAMASSMGVVIGDADGMSYNHLRIL